MGKSDTNTKKFTKIVHDSELDKFLSDHLFTKDGLLDIDEEDDLSNISTTKDKNEEKFLDTDSTGNENFEIPDGFAIDFSKPVDDSTIFDAEKNAENTLDNLPFDLPDELAELTEETIEEERTFSTSSEISNEEMKGISKEDIDNSIKNIPEANEEIIFGQDAEKETTKEILPSKEQVSTINIFTQKWFLLTLVLFLLSIIIVVGIILFTSKSTRDLPKETTSVSSEEPEEAPLLEEQIVEWQPFWIDKSTENKVTFFTIKFTTKTRSERVLAEAKEKEHLIRDSIYFYLQKINTDDLDKNTSIHLEKIKKDILAIINSFLTTGSFPEIGVENILVQ